MVLLKTRTGIINFANVESIETDERLVVCTTVTGKEKILIDCFGWFGMHEINEESTEAELESAKNDYDYECRFAEDVVRYILLALARENAAYPTVIDIEQVADICFKKEVTGEITADVEDLMETYFR